VTFGLIAFDLDGTLVNSLRDLAESANALLVECGAAPLEEDAVGRMVGDGAAALVHRAFAAAGVPEPADALARFLGHYDARLLRWTRPYPGVSDLLAALTDRGMPLAVLTNKPREATREVLAGLDLARYFPPARVFGGDGPFPRKPDPSGLRRLMEMAGASAGTTILVGDSIIDFRTARAADARICMARYGFGFESFPAGHLLPADRTIDAPLELLTIL
jgi:phosphoglycolate phosphatase